MTRMDRETKRKINWPRILLYLLGMLLLAVGLTLNTRVTLGVSAIISVPYCAAELAGVSIGDATLVLYVVFIGVEVLLHLLRKAPDRKRVVLFDVLQLPLGLVFTRFMNLFSAIIPLFERDFAGSFWGSLWVRLCLMLLAITLTGTGAALTLRMRLIPNPGDGIVQTLADFFSKKVGTMKNIVDLCCVAVSAAVALCFARRIIGIGIGTVMAALLTGRVVALVNRLCGDRLDVVRAK